MNDTMLQRLFWKEYRTQRGFWLGVAGMGLVLQFIVLMVTDQIDMRTSTLFSISFVMPVFYVLGSTAMTFAAEREEETWNRLRILAAAPGRLFLAKFGFSVVSTLLMAAVLVLLSWIMASGRIPDDLQRGMIDSRTWMLTAGEFLVWGTFISLFTRRILSAVFLTPVCVLSFVAVASSADEQLWTIRLVMMAFLLLASIGLSRRWLKRETLGWPIPWSISLRWKRTDYLAAVETGSPQKRLFQRLTWQEQRQARAICFVFLAIGLPLVAISYGTKRALTVDFALIIISLVPLLCGVWVFRGEQEGKRFRYLTECGVTPQTLWLSKQCVWITATFVLVMLFVITDLYASSFHFHPFHMDVLSGYQQTSNKITWEIGSRSYLPVFILYCIHDVFHRPVGFDAVRTECDGSVCGVYVERPVSGVVVLDADVERSAHILSLADSLCVVVDDTSSLFGLDAGTSRIQAVAAGGHYDCCAGDFDCLGNDLLPSRDRVGGLQADCGGKVQDDSHPRSKE
jgi:hypothetical protein